MARVLEQGTKTRWVIQAVENSDERSVVVRFLVPRDSWPPRLPPLP